MIASSIFSAIALVSCVSASTCGLGLPLAVDNVLPGSCGSRLIGSGLYGSGLLSSDLYNTGLFGSALPYGVNGILPGNRLIDSGLINNGICGSGLINAGLPLSRTQCTCTKTSLRPKITQVVRNVPSLRRVVENIVTPVVNQQQYSALPASLVNTPCGLNNAIIGGGCNNAFIGSGLNNAFIGSGLNNAVLGGGLYNGCSDLAY